MAIYKFRVYLDEDTEIYRDIEIHAAQTLMDLHEGILHAFKFDDKHFGSFFKANDNWIKGKEYSTNKKNKNALPADKTILKNSIDDPHQKFLYEYYSTKIWEFQLELLTIVVNGAEKTIFPKCVRTEGIAPKQYGNKPNITNGDKENIFEENLAYGDDEQIEETNGLDENDKSESDDSSESGDLDGIVGSDELASEFEKDF